MGQDFNDDDGDEKMWSYTWKLAPSKTGSGEPRSNIQFKNNLKYGLGLKEDFFSSASFWMTLTATARICQQFMVKWKKK